MKRINMIGKIYGSLLVLEELNREIKVECICGNLKWCLRGNVLAGYTTSCGCYRDQQVRNKNSTHGHRSNPTPTYLSWRAMKRRCDNPCYDHYDRYGGRGITYDKRWSAFSAFMADMGERPEGRELDRADNNGHYTKANCRWVSHKDNCKNRGY